MSDIFTGTPAGLTYDHEIVRQAWMAVWIITSGALVVIVGWMGLSLIVGDHVGRAQAGWRELVPRLALGLVAAAASLWWCALVIDVADAVSGFIAAELGVTAGDMLRSTLETLLTAVSVGSVGMALLLALVYLVYGFFVLYLVVQMVLRLALIDILLALAPIALGLWILPHTAGWGRHWLRLFMTTVFQQAIQLVALALGIGFLNEYAAIGGADGLQDLVWKLLMSLAFIYLATRVPSLLGNAGTFDAWLHTLYFGMSLPGSLARSARSIGLLAGGGAAGPPGPPWERPLQVARSAPARTRRRRACAPRPRPPRPPPAAATPRPDRACRAAAASNPATREATARPWRREAKGNGGGRCAGRRTNDSTGTEHTHNARSEQQMEDLVQTISNLVGILLGVVGAIGVGYFIYGSYLYLTASGAPHQMERGKSAMMTALAGIVLAMVAFGIVELVIDAVVDPTVDPDVPDPTTLVPPGGEARHA